MSGFDCGGQKRRPAGIEKLPECFGLCPRAGRRRQVGQTSAVLLLYPAMPVSAVVAIVLVWTGPDDHPESHTCVSWTVAMAVLGLTVLPQIFFTVWRRRRDGQQ